MDLEKIVVNFLQQANWQHGPIVVAVSGGVDSMMLLNACLAVKQSTKRPLVIAHVNHQLRRESIQEQQFLENWAHQHNAIIEVGQWDRKLHPKSGTEAAAREFRYNFFAKVVKKYHANGVLVAHTADEQAEEFMLKLIRGGRWQQLAGMPSIRVIGNVQVGRPFLHIRKSTLILAATQAQLTWFEDATNQTNAYMRNRIRHEILPKMEQENDQVIAHIVDYQAQLEQANRLLAEVIDKKLVQLSQAGALNLAKFLKEDADWQASLLRRYINQIDSTISFNNHKVKEILELLHNKVGQGQITLNAQWILVKEYTTFRATKKTSHEANFKAPVMVILDSWTTVDTHLQVRLSTETKPTFYETFKFTANQVKLPLQVRPTRSDDRLGLKSGGSKSVRRDVIDQKISNEHRKNLWSVVDQDNQVLWVIGVRKAWLKIPQDFNQPMYQLTIKMEDD